ncbi:hypothetical protein E5288_WYG004986 [Bos mutus]|uniref:PR domain zinc finger protein 16 n=1 Tax=Bos mutus TaxID=72004 RepID=A0A6B0QXA7_9CETA|nr:hypothetical protein [Bos mutus]
MLVITSVPAVLMCTQSKAKPGSSPPSSGAQTLRQEQLLGRNLTASSSETLRETHSAHGALELDHSLRDDLSPLKPAPGNPFPETGEKGTGVLQRIVVSTGRGKLIEDITVQISEDLDGGKLCVDAQHSGAGSWLKYIRVACSCDDQNLTMCQINEQIYYKVIKDIEPGEELLVHVKEGAYSLGAVPPSLDEEPTFRCDACDELFPSKLDLRRHKKYACSSVGAALYEGLAEELKPEGLGGGGSDGQAHECKDCERMFPTKYSLEQHMVVHTEEREYKCDQCPKAFNWKSNLIRHQMSHDSGKRFECENCVKVFTDPSNLQRHIRSQHVGARAHACPDCGKTFATSSGLKQHKHIHSTVKPFICEVCHKSYTQFSNLCRHKRMHADCRTQIKCKDCGQMFSTTSSLNKHRRFCEGKNHYPPGGIFAPGLPLTPSPLMDKAKPPPGLNHAGLGFGEYFPSRPHPGSLPFSTAPPSFPTLTPGFPGIFPPSLYPRPPLLPPTPLLKSPLNHTQDAKLPSPLGNPALPLVSAVGNSSQGTAAAAGPEEKLEGHLEEAYATKLKPRGSDLTVPPGAPNTVGEVPVFYSQHFFPPPQEQLLTAAGAAGDSIKAIASIAEKYFGPGFMGVPEKKLGALPYHSVFPFQFLPHLPHSLYPFTDRALTHNLLVKAEPKSPRDALKASGPSAESPFDLTTKPKEAKPILPAPKVPPAPASGEEQPLDLSIGSRARASQNGGAREPRKNHVYGERRLGPSEGLPKACPAQLPQQPPLHYAKPSPFFMDPIYSRVEKRKVTDPVGALKEKYLRPSPLLFHPQMSAIETMTEKLESFAAMKVDSGSSLQPLPHHPFNFRSPPPTLSDPILRKGKERYTCRYCGKIFPRSANLTRHLRTHTGEQPYRELPPALSRKSSAPGPSGQPGGVKRPVSGTQGHWACPDSPVSQHAGVLTNHLGTSASSPTSESDNHALLDEKEDSYFSEIRNFIANSEMNQASTRTDKRPEVQDLDGTSHLAGKSQDDTASPTPEPQGAYEDDEDEEPPTSLAVGFDHTRRCVEEPPGGLLALEPMPTFGKGLDLRRTAEETFEVKDVLNSTLDSETLKQTLYRQAKNQAYAMMLSLSEDTPLHASSQGPLDAWLNIAGATPESGAFNPINHL